MATEQYTCKACGGTLKWNIQKQTFECASCRAPAEIDAEKKKIHQHPIEDFKKLENEDTSLMEVSTIVCGNCGAEVVFSGTQTAAVCPMCGSSQVNTAKQKAGVEPDGIVPFKIDKQDAQQEFKKWVGSRWFAPNKLKESYQQGKLDGVYLPFWTYDTNAKARYIGEGGNYITTTDEDGDTTTETEWFPVSGKVRMDFNDYPVCCTDGRAQSVVEDILPYSTEDLAVNYAGCYLSGFNAEHYAFDAEKGFDKAQQGMEDELRSEAYNDIIRKGYDTADVRSIDPVYENVEYKQMLLPAWLSAFSYGGKQYTYMINGETGKVSGERPYSIPKIIAAVIAGIVVLFLLYNIFMKDADACEYIYPLEQTVQAAQTVDTQPTAENGAVITISRGDAVIGLYDHQVEESAYLLAA